MPHVREQIRVAALAALDSLTTTGTRAEASRIYNSEASDLPNLTIYTEDETSEFDVPTNYPRKVSKALELIVEGRAKAVSGLDNTLDDIEVEVNAILAPQAQKGQRFGNLIKDIYLESSTIELSSEGNQPLGLIRMKWMVEYRIYENDAETAIQ